jgi:hypothetical protein
MVGTAKRPTKRSRGAGSALSRRRQTRLQRWFSWVPLTSLRRRQLLMVLLGAAVILIVVGIATATADVARAARDGRRGENALFAAVAQFDSAAASTGDDRGRLRAAKADLAEARRDFDAMHGRLSGALLAPARVTPFVRIQVRGADDMAQAGIELSAAGEHLADVASGLLAPSDASVPLRDSLGRFQSLDSAAQASTAALQDALARIAPLASYRLIGPVASARATLFVKLPHIEQRVAGGDQALRAFEDFLGAAGSRQYLVLSQNPDEVRPTGGFIGTYGLMRAANGHVSLPEFGDMSQFLTNHPNVFVSENDAPSVFGIADSDQTLGDVNATPDWPTAAQLAVKLWQQAGQPAVNGVVSITPSFLARIVGVLGPVVLPSYGETITASNLQARVDYWAHQAPGGGNVNRHEFLSELSQVVLQEALDAPASKWHALGNAAAAGFDASEAMVWFSDPTIQTAAAAHRWDHPFPAAQPGTDFLYDSEFEFVAKNGSGLHRVFQHTVVVNPDGSGRATTTMSMTNTEPPGRYSATSAIFNIGAPDYVVAYGPSGAKLDGSSDPPYYAFEPPLAGHPAAGWLLTPAPLSTVRVKVAWDVPHLLRQSDSNKWVYHLVFPKLPAHDGDMLRLSVVLPPHWRWQGAGPPSEIPLNRDVNQSWNIVSS